MKFSIITPSYNSKKYIEETIQSVLSQEGNFEIEYIIVDGASSDKTLNIITKYDQLLKENKYEVKCNKIIYKWISEKDTGMYAAINKGFAMATGDIYAWINSDDIYLPEAFEAVSKTFEKYPNIKWLKGITSVIDETSAVTDTIPCYLYNQEWIKKGIYGRNAYFIHQDSVFWRAEIWDKVKKIDEKYKFAGDYYLWIKFAEYAPLYSLKQNISCFRKIENQLSNDMKLYRKEQTCIFPYRGFINKKVAAFFRFKYKCPKFMQFLFPIFYRILFGKQDLNFVELINGKPIFKKSSYCIIK